MRWQVEQTLLEPSDRTDGGRRGEATWLDTTDGRQGNSKQQIQSQIPHMDKYNLRLLTRLRPRLRLVDDCTMNELHNTHMYEIRGIHLHTWTNPNPKYSRYVS